VSNDGRDTIAALEYQTRYPTWKNEQLLDAFVVTRFELTKNSD